jgi:beta-lactamase class A
LKISHFSLFRWIAIILVVLAAILLVIQLIQFSRIRAGFPPGTLIGGIAVGGLNQQQAADRVTQAYNNPIELLYKDQSIQVKPSQLGFNLNVESMIAAADQQRVKLPFWSSFWDYLWNRSPVAHDTPLSATLDENRIKLFLMDEIASRYDEVPLSSQPIPGTINFQLGKPGVVLNVDKSLVFVEQALQSPFNRSAQLSVGEVNPPRPSLENLGVLIKQILDKSNFDGLTEVYVLDLEKRNEISFAYEKGVNYDPGIAFTAASTIKIPIMVSTFKRVKEPTPQAAADLMTQMIEKSDNIATDKLMETYLAPNIGPIYVTQDMQEIGLKNTFLAGEFYLGAPLLQRFSTPANLRRDYFTSPDVYNQTTPPDMGMLLDDIYQCAQTGGGTFAAVFQGEISQSECQMMITYLSQNKIAVLLQAGIPDGTKIAHKHGWVVESDGVIHSIIDAGIIFSPGGDYVAVVAMYQPTQLIYDVANYLTAQISTSIYNYFNIS